VIAGRGGRLIRIGRLGRDRGVFDDRRLLDRWLDDRRLLDRRLDGRLFDDRRLLDRWGDDSSGDAAGSSWAASMTELASLGDGLSSWATTGFGAAAAAGIAVMNGRADRRTA